MVYKIQQSLSLKKETRTGLFLFECLHPLDQEKRERFYLNKNNVSDKDEIEGIKVLSIGERFAETLDWLEKSIDSFPYVWPFEGKSLDRYGYDFTCTLSNNEITSLELSEIGYHVIRNYLDIEDPNYIPYVVEEEYFKGGGAFVKFSVTLDERKPVNEIVLHPFTSFPLDIVSITYETDIENYSERKELIPQTVSYSEDGIKFVEPEERISGVNTIIFKFEEVSARRLTFILKQKNYTINNYLIREEVSQKNSLWDKIKEREATVTLDETDGLETLTQKELDKKSGWDNYLKERNVYQKKHKEWKDAMSIYNEKIAERNKMIQAKEKEEARYKQAVSDYRSEYNKAKKAYEDKQKSYEKRLASYKKEKKAYDKKLKAYKDYLKKIK